MNNQTLSLTHLSDERLIARVKELVGEERETIASLIAHLGEVDERKLFLAEGCGSLFTYCVEVLHFSENEAWRRIQVARCARKFPVILERLADGSVNLATAALLVPHLTPENHLELLEAARFQSKRQVEELVARVRPLPAVPLQIRKLPARPGIGTNGNATGDASQGMTPEIHLPERFGSAIPETIGDSLFLAANKPVPARTAPRAGVAPLAPELYKVQFTATAETYKKLRQVQELLRHQVPNGDPAVIVDKALTLLLEKLLKQKLAATDRPRKPQTRSRIGFGVNPRSSRSSGEKGAQTNGLRPRPTESRHIPAEVKRVVWNRDGGRCAFIGRHGRRCSARDGLEFHHVEPYILGGKATVENIQLRCRPHNAYEGATIFGPRRPGHRTHERNPGHSKGKAIGPQPSPGKVANKTHGEVPVP